MRFSLEWLCDEQPSESLVVLAPVAALTVAGDFLYLFIVANKFLQSIAGLDKSEIFSYIYCMAAAKQKGPGRPKKPTGQVRKDDLRIPLTAAEKAQIRRAAQESGGKGEMAEWARRILLDAVRKSTNHGK